MVYSASSNALKARLNGIAVEIQGNDESDLEWAVGELYGSLYPLRD